MDGLKVNWADITYTANYNGLSVNGLGLTLYKGYILYLVTMFIITNSLENE